MGLPSPPRHWFSHDDNVSFRRLCFAVLLVVLGCQAPAIASAASSPPPSPRRLRAGSLESPRRTSTWCGFSSRTWGTPSSARPSAPYLNSLSDRCGLATNYLAISHPSLPNYIALTSGTTHGITDDAEPVAHPLGGPSIFSELDGNWRGLIQSMPAACDHVTSGSYAARHNPAVYYVNLDATCRAR